MKIAFDEQIFCLQQYGGISRYFCSLARGLSEFENIEARIFAPLHRNEHLRRQNKQNFFPSFAQRLGPKLTRLSNEASRLLGQVSVSSFRPDIYHQTYYTTRSFCPRGAFRVLTVYDLIHMRYPDCFVNADRTITPQRMAAGAADHVICISNSTRDDLVRYFGVSEKKTSVVYLGVDPVFSRPPAREFKMLNRPFLLYVGARAGYKNFRNFLRAFSQSKLLTRDFDLVCFGGGPLNDAEKQYASQLGLQLNAIHHISGTDEYLSSIYRKAEVLVYPSLFEGFGIPPLEAMAAGCPVVCSDTSSLPEVVGNAAQMFDPVSSESIMNSIESVLYSPSRTAELIALGQRRHKKFTWAKCAEETLKLYRGLV